MSFWTSLESELTAAIKSLGPQITAAANYFKPMVQASAQELAQVALQAVLAQAPAVISGQQKLSNATSQVLTTLGTAGKTVAVADATAAIQAAYNAVSAAAHPVAGQTVN